MDLWSRWFLMLAIAVVCVGILGRAAMSLDRYINQPVMSLHKDVDWAWLNGGLDQIHKFGDTGRWWTGTWCGGVPFWRPLTSYAFLGMRLIWPKEYMLPRQIILVMLHLCFTVLAAALLWKLTRRPWLVLLALYLFAGMRPYHFGDPQAYVRPVDDLLLDPKNIPDTLVGLSIIGSLLLLMSGRWLAALGMAAVSVGFKENGFTTWPLAVFVLGWMRRDQVLSAGGAGYVIERIRRYRLQIGAWTLVFLFLVFVHFVTVGVGFRQGSNNFWCWRVAVFVGWPTLSNLFLFDRTAGFMSCLLFAAGAITWRRRLIVKFVAVLCAIALGIIIDTRLEGTTWAISATRLLFLGQDFDTILKCLLWLVVVWMARFDWRHVGLGVLLALAAGAPSWMASQTWAHTRYVASVFMETAAAAVILQDITCMREFFARLRHAD